MPKTITQQIQELQARRNTLEIGGNDLEGATLEQLNAQILELREQMKKPQTDEEREAQIEQIAKATREAPHSIYSM